MKHRSLPWLFWPLVGVTVMAGFALLRGSGPALVRYLKIRRM
jgi:hypothetical protein